MQPTETRVSRVHSILAFCSVASLPLYDPSRVVSSLLTVPDVFIGLFVVSSLLRYRPLRPAAIPGIVWSLTGILLIATYSIAWNHAYGGLSGDRRIVIRLAELLVFSYCIILSLRSGLSETTLFAGYLASVVLVVVVGFAQKYLGVLSYIVFPWGPYSDLAEDVSQADSSGLRVYSVLGNPLKVITYLIPLWGWTIYALQTRKNLRLALGFIAITTPVAIWSGSKIFVPIALLLLYFGIVHTTTVKRLALLGAVALGGLLVATFGISNDTGSSILIVSRFRNPEDQYGSVNQRLYVWRAALGMIGGNPVLGVGPGNFPDVYDRDFRQAGSSGDSLSSNAENFFLQRTAEAGLIAGLLYIAIFGSVFLRRNLDRVDVITFWSAVLLFLVVQIDSNRSVPIEAIIVIVLSVRAGHHAAKRKRSWILLQPEFRGAT